MKYTTRFLDSISIPYGVRKADRVIAVSSSTRLDILKNFKNTKAIDVIYPASKFELSLYRNTSNRITEKLLIGKGYILFVGSFEPRKNIARLLEAYSMLDNNTKKSHQLVCVGFKGWKFDINLTVNELGLKDSVKVIRQPSDQILKELYQGALFLTMPSLYEGFGIPIVEAMTFGLPILTSNNSSMAEICHDCGVLVDPLDVVSIHKGIKLLISDKDLRRELSSKSIAKSKKYSWLVSAKKIKNLFAS